MEKIGSKRLVMLSILIIGMWKTTVAVTPPSYPWTTVRALFVFGDSLVDSGTNNFINGSTTRADFLPYGETFFHRGTGRFTNGRHSFDFIAARLGLPFMPPFLKPGATFKQGVNFASAGSGVLNSTGLGDGVNSLSLQVYQFQQVVGQLTSDLGETEATYLISNALYSVVVASNDLLAYLKDSTLQQTVSPTKFVTTLLFELQGHAHTIYALGARKVVFLGIGPLGCAPWILAPTNGTNGMCLDEPNQLALAYNVALLQLVQTLNSQLPGLRAVFVNHFETIEGFINNKTAQGFTESSNACCGSGPFNGAVQCGPDTNLCNNVNNFVFWDLTHPTEQVNRQIAEKMWDGDSSFIQQL